MLTFITVGGRSGEGGLLPRGARISDLKGEGVPDSVRGDGGRGAGVCVSGTRDKSGG